MKADAAIINAAGAAASALLATLPSRIYANKLTLLDWQNRSNIPENHDVLKYCALPYRLLPCDGTIPKGTETEEEYKMALKNGYKTSRHLKIDKLEEYGHME
ncbi:MAG: hypothetical protein IPN13_06990 [Bacteroidetes bacterium]|nr:hypothetical protein [Bacteroidota bacterium]